MRTKTKAHGCWYSQRYGYYNTSLLLPDDAEMEHIKAEVKNGILYVTIPKSICREEAEYYGGENPLAIPSLA